MQSVLLLLVVAICLTSVRSFVSRGQCAQKRIVVSSLNALDADTIGRLDELKEKFTRLSNVVSDESDAEKAKISDVVEKYDTYKEVKTMMGKLRLMWRAEASDRRKAKQLKSFTDLYNGKLEMEEVLKEKLGLPYNKESVSTVKELATVADFDAKIAKLTKDLESVEMVIPSGMSTRDERFFGQVKS